MRSQLRLWGAFFFGLTPSMPYTDQRPGFSTRTLSQPILETSVNSRIPHLAVAALLALSAASASASSFYLMVPLPGKTSSAPPTPGGHPPGSEVDPKNIHLTLQASSRFSPQAGFPFEFNVKDLLTVTGDPSYTGAGVRFDYGSPIPGLPSGSGRPTSYGLPFGIGLSEAGVLGGRPLEADGNLWKFTVSATYKGQTTEQAYELAIQAAPELAWIPTTPFRTKSGRTVMYDLRQAVSVHDNVGSGYVDFRFEGLPNGLEGTTPGLISGVVNLPPGDYPFMAWATYRGITISSSFNVTIYEITLNLDRRIDLGETDYYPDFEQHRFYRNIGGFGMAQGDPFGGEYVWTLESSHPAFSLTEWGDLMLNDFWPEPGTYELPAHLAYKASDGQALEARTVFVVTVPPRQ